MGNGDVTYNSRRSILATISFKGAIAYNFFKIDSHAPKSSDIVKFCRKTKWHSENSNMLIELINPSLFFHQKKISLLSKSLIFSAMSYSHV